MLFFARINLTTPLRRGSSSSLFFLLFCVPYGVASVMIFNHVEPRYRHFSSKILTYFSQTQVFEKFIGVWGLLHDSGTE